MDDEPTTPPVELEVKFILPEAMNDALDAHPALGAGGWETRRQVATYFDTPDEAIARWGGSLRVRVEDGRPVQTLKLPGSEGGPFARGEWGWPLDRPALDPRLLVDTPLAGLADVADHLHPVFTVEVERAVRRLSFEGAEIELSRDAGTIRAGAATEDVRELELELKDGRPATLYRLALSLSEALPLRLGAENKSDRGWRLRRGRPRSAEDAAMPDFREGTTGLEAVRRIVGSCLRNLLAARPSATAGEKEGVHGMRIAVRRVRTALALFRPHLQRDAEARFTGDLRRLGRNLGEPRDWDVFCTGTLDAASADGVAASLLEPLRAAAEERRAAAHERLAGELAEGTLTALVLGMLTWVEDPAALTGSPGGGRLSDPLGDLATRLEERLERKVLRRGRRIRRLDEEGLHDLRKSLKRLRYAVEFTASLQRPKRVRRHLKGCKGLQESLGAINDATVAVTLASALGEGRPDLAPAVAALRDWAETRRARADDHLRKDWRRFREEQLPR